MSAVEENIQRLGGMVPIGDGFIPVEEEEIASIEHRLGATLPREYREFLKQFGASMFAAYVDFSLADSRPIYSGDPSVPISTTALP